MAIFTFDMEANREKIQAFRSFIDDNRLRKGVLMPVLQDAQSRFGYLIPAQRATPPLERACRWIASRWAYTSPYPW